MFDGFKGHVSVGDRIACEVGDFRAFASVHSDDDQTPPWEREEGHGPVSEWTDREPRPGERVLSEDGNLRLYYDFAGAVRTAKAEGWDSEPYGVGTVKERSVRAAEKDFETLKAWCDGEWQYVGVAVTVYKDDVRLTDRLRHALWGVECNHPAGNGHLLEVANELLPEALEAARAKLSSLAAHPPTPTRLIRRGGKDGSPLLPTVPGVTRLLLTAEGSGVACFTDGTCLSFNPAEAVRGPEASLLPDDGFAVLHAGEVEERTLRRLEELAADLGAIPYVEPGPEDTLPSAGLDRGSSLGISGP